MARPTKPEKHQLIAQARTCLKKGEYAALGRYARIKNKTVSALMRELILAEIAAASALFAPHDAPYRRDQQAQ